MLGCGPGSGGFKAVLYDFVEVKNRKFVRILAMCNEECQSSQQLGDFIQFQKKKRIIK